MIVKTKAIVLRNVHYGETSVITKLFCRELGLRSYLINGVRKPKAKISMASLQALNLLQIEAYDKANANLQRIKELRCEPLLMQIIGDFRKRGVAMFLVELLNACLLNEEGDPQLYDFLEQEILLLERGEEVSNFPLLFMIRFGRELGISPHGSYSEVQPFFDLETGSFTAISSENSLSKDLSHYCYELMQAEASATHLNIPLKLRRDLLNSLILYFQFHIMHDRKLKSLKVLTEVMEAWHTV